ncbi:unnamed protein product [Orchesella dallaii]|uniref:Ionotropic glutamate receptor L-glutamate and glycine-binding domain-containing protein n=1 Tax=Orchesella dallaii TaxID=48710 RepID=A0ABP1QHQ9_9HEXA
MLHHHFLTSVTIILIRIGSLHHAASDNYIAIQNVIENYFASCEVLVVEDINSNKENENFIVNLIPNLATRLTISLQYFPLTVFPVNPRKYSQCMLILSDLKEGEKYLERFHNLLVSKYGAVTKREEDYYIFMTDEMFVSAVLESFFTSIIKYKLVLTKTNENSLGFSHCFYCAQGGKSKTVSINWKTATSFQEIFPDWTLNGNGYLMRTSSPVKYKFTTEILQIKPGQWELIRGISKYIMEHVLPHYNFTYIVFSSPNGDTGKPDKNGTWDGCVGQLLSGDADLALTTSANRARFLKIGFSTAAFYAWVSFTVGQPRRTYSWRAIFWPFQLELWIAIGISLVAIILVFKVFQRFEIYLGRIGRQVNFKLKIYKNLPTQIVFALIGKEVHYPEFSHSRILLCFWLLPALVINTLYNSKIVALLALPTYQHPPRTFEALVDSRYEWGMDISGGSLFAYFESSTNPIFRQVFKKLSKPKETVDCFTAAIKTKFACITWAGQAGVADYISYRNFTLVDGKMPLVRADEIINFVPCGLAMPRSAVFKPNFDKTISWVYDTGHGKKWIMEDLMSLQMSYVKWMEERNKKVVKYGGDGGAVMLKLSNILGVFYVFGCGCVAALLWFLVEQCINWTTESFGAPTKKHEDYFIFITTQELVLPFLDSRIVQTIKYKIIVPINKPIRSNEASSTFVNAFTPSCIFCYEIGVHPQYFTSELTTLKMSSSLPLSKIFPDITLNGNLYTLRVTSPIKYPFLVELEKVGNHHPPRWNCKRGIFAYILNALTPHFNFTYKIFPSSNGDTGKPLGNGSWSGVIGDILNERAHIGVSTTYSPVRYQSVSFTNAFEYIWVTFMVGQPQKSYSWKAMLWPFQKELWFSILISLGLVILTFKFIERIETNMNQRYEKEYKLSILEFSFTLIGKEIQYPNSTSARLLLCIWLLSSLLINSAYLSKIVELLAFPVYQRQPKSFRELIDPKLKFQFGMDLSGGALMTHFESSSNPVLKNLLERILPPKKAVDCFNTSLRKNFACIAWRGTADYVAYRNLTLVHGKSPLIAADDDKTLFVPQGLVLQRNSILKPVFDRYLEMLMDSGQSFKWTMDDLEELNREKIKWQKSINISMRGEEEERNLLRISNLLGVFYLLIIGTMCSVFVLVIEKMERILVRKTLLL